MTHDEKVTRLLNDLGQRGISRYTIAPPMYRLLWRLGIELKPPHFASFWSLAAVMGVGYGVFLAVFMGASTWASVRQSKPLSAVIGIAALAAVLFGLFMGGYYRMQARKLGLPRWENYPAS